MRVKILAVVFLGFCSANLYAATDRDVLMQKELNCISQQQKSGLTWGDICSMPDPAPAVDASQSQIPATASPAAFNSRVNTFSLSYQPYYYHYSEPNKAKKYTGFWNGFEGKYTLRPPQGNIFNNPLVNFYALEGTYANGDSVKEGNQTRSQTDGTIIKHYDKNIPNYMFELRALLGRDFTPVSNVRLTPYIGYGVRYKMDQSGGHFDPLDNATPPSPALGYDRSDLYTYIPIGITADLMTSQDYEISFNAEYDYFIKGYERDRYSDANEFTVPLYFGLTSNKALYPQNRGFGSRFSLKFLKHFSLVDIFIEPYINYWHIGKSKSVSTFITGNAASNTANKNTTLETGCRMGVEF